MQPASVRSLDLGTRCGRHEPAGMQRAQRPMTRKAAALLAHVLAVQEVRAYGPKPVLRSAP